MIQVLLLLKSNLLASWMVEGCLTGCCPGFIHDRFNQGEQDRHRQTEPQLTLAGHGEAFWCGNWWVDYTKCPLLKVLSCFNLGSRLLQQSLIDFCSDKVTKQMIFWQRQWQAHSPDAGTAVAGSTIIKNHCLNHYGKFHFMFLL